MTDSVYLSYAPTDEAFAEQVRDYLLQEGFTIWQDDAPLALSESQRIQQVMSTSWVIVALLSPHYFKSERCINEGKHILNLNKPLLPVIVQSVELPSTIRRRQPINFVGEFAPAAANLCQRLTWLRSPRGEIQVLRDRLSDLERILARGQQSPQIHGIRTQADELRQEIADREQSLMTPTTPLAPKPTPASPDVPSPPVQHRREDWGEAPDITVFYGRQYELDELTRWIVEDHCRMIGILAMGGMGKTALVTKLVNESRMEFTHILWKSVRNAPPLEDLLAESIVFFSDQQRTDLPDDTSARIGLLLDYFRQKRCVLVLDNMETILQGGDRTGAYREDYEGYGQLIQRVGESQHQSVLLLTSREKPREFARLEGTKSSVRVWYLAGIHQQDGQAILQDKGLSGDEDAWTDLVNRYSGNPLALKLIAETVREIFSGDIVDFLRGGETILDDISQVLGEQFSRLSPLERDIMYWLAIEREPVSADDLRNTMVAPILNRGFIEALSDLQRRSLVERGGAGFTLQNVVMEYATEQLIEQACDEVVQNEINLLNTHALMKAQAKEYVRNSQVRLILNEVIDRLTQRLGSRETVAEQLTGLLGKLRSEAA